MPTIPNITRKEIQEWTDEGSFQRGSHCFQEGAIYNQRLSKMTLKSECAGTQAPFYHQEVTFHEKGIRSAKCSCPVGSDGRCKHVVALLLTWIENQKSFQPVKNIDTVLATKTQAELMTIIRRFLAVDPHLEHLVNLPLANKNKKISLDLKAIQRQVSQAQRQLTRNYWDSNCHVQVNSLQAIITLANEYLTQDEAANAVAIYSILCNTLLDEKDLLLSDEEGNLGSIIIDCVKHLIEYLPTTNDSDLRRQIFEVLFSVYKQDILEMGGIGLSDDIPDIFIQQTSPNEKRDIATWFEEAIPEGDEGRAKFSQHQIGEMLLELRKDHLDDESYLTLCRKTQLIEHLVDRLLESRRVDEALQASQTVNDYDLLRLADVFVHHQYPSLAEELVIERTKTSKDVTLLNWLKFRAEEKGGNDELLMLAEEIFWQRPNLDSFREIARCAQKTLKIPLNWEEKQHAILSKLEEDKHFVLLIEIHLDRCEIQSALSSWKKLQTEIKHGNTGKLRLGKYRNTGELRLRLARAAAKELPHESIDLYLQIVHSVIARRNREAYAEAATHLKEVKALYLKLDQEPLWNKVINELRTQYRTLNALKDELNKAKL